MVWKGIGDYSGPEHHMVSHIIDVPIFLIEQGKTVEIACRRLNFDVLQF